MYIRNPIYKIVCYVLNIRLHIFDNKYIETAMVTFCIKLDKSEIQTTVNHLLNIFRLSLGHKFKM